MPSQQGPSSSGPQPVQGFPPSQPPSGPPAAQSHQPQQPHPAEQHHEQASAERSYDGQPSYDDQGYDDRGYAAPGREEQIVPGLEFSANFGNRGYSIYGDAAETDPASLSGQARGDGYGLSAGQQGQAAGQALAGQQGASAEEESAAAQYSQFGPPSAGQPQRLPSPQPQQAQESGEFLQFAQSMATLSAPVAADAAAGGQWSPSGTQTNSSTGAHPAYGAAHAQHAYQDESAYYGGSGQDRAGGAAGGTSGYQPASTSGQLAAPAPANGYSYPEADYAPNGNAANGYTSNGNSSNSNSNIQLWQRNGRQRSQRLRLSRPRQRRSCRDRCLPGARLRKLRRVPSQQSRLERLLRQRPPAERVQRQRPPAHRLQRQRPPTQWVFERRRVRHRRFPG